MSEMTLKETLAYYGNKDYIGAVIGTQISDTETYDDILKTDGNNIPFTLSESGTHTPTGASLPYECYYDPKYVALEREQIWLKHWQVACREEDIPNVGDRVGYDVGTLSFLVVRSGPQEFKAFYNSCRHRGRRICGDVPESGELLQCPFHAWTYDLEGKLQWIPRKENFPGVTEKAFSLREIQCGTWGGNIFINPDLKAPPLEKVLGVMPEHFKDFPVEERYTWIRLRKKIRINWKSALEAFLEGYHVITTHPSGMPMFGSTYTKYDMWDDGVSHVSRLATPAVVPDGWIKSKVPTTLALQLFCNTYGFDAPPPDRGETVADARAYSAEAMRQRIKDETGEDVSDRSVAYLIDMVQWYMFPNFFPWWGEGLAWWYNFLPHGDNPDECIMEVRWTKPLPKDGTLPPRAVPVDIDFDEKGVDYPETGQAGRLLDEDIFNMVEVHRGMKAARADSARGVLNVEEEARIRHFMEVYAKTIGLAEAKA